MTDNLMAFMHKASAPSLDPADTAAHTHLITHDGRVGLSTFALFSGVGSAGAGGEEENPGKMLLFQLNKQNKVYVADVL